MKRIISLTLALLFVLSLTACGGESTEETTIPPTTAVPTEAPTEAPTEMPTEAPTEMPTEAPSESTDPKMGYYSSDGTYINEFLGIQCKLTEDWTVSTEEELAQLCGITADAIDNEALSEQLRNSGLVYTFYAVADQGLVSMNIVLENLGLLYGTVLDVDSYLELSLDQASTALESLGMENVTAEITTVTFAGESHSAIRVHGTYQDVDFYEVLVCLKVDNYMACTTIGSYYEDITSELLTMYEPIL